MGSAIFDEAVIEKLIHELAASTAAEFHLFHPERYKTLGEVVREVQNRIDSLNQSLAVRLREIAEPQDKVDSLYYEMREAESHGWENNF